MSIEPGSVCLYCEVDSFSRAVASAYVSTNAVALSSFISGCVLGFVRASTFARTRKDVVTQEAIFVTM